MKATYTSPDLPQPLFGHGGGAYNSETGRSRALVHAAAPGGRQVTIETVADDTSVYMRGDRISSGLPAGKEWLQIQPFLGHSQSEAMLGGSGAESSLQMLGAAGGIEKLGREEVRGASTLRYRATVAFDDYADALREEGKDEIADQYEKYAALGSPPPTVEAWVDDSEVLRRCRMVMEIPSQPGQPVLTMDMQMDLFDFGAHPQIDLPDPDRVYDATPLLEEELDEAAS